MSPARRKRLVKKERSRFLGILFKIGALLTAAIFFLLLFAPKYWDKNSKLSLIINAGDGVYVSTFDPELDEITNIFIPGTTQVGVARNLGTWKIKSVAKLGEHEGVGGILLAETVTKNFKFPVVTWAQEPALGFSRGGPEIVRALLSPYKTNLKFGDRVRLFIFSLQVKSFKKEEIDLGKTSILRKTKLKDGEDGYIVSSSVPQSILVIFSDSEISSKALKVSIKDATGKAGVAADVGGIVETLGAKVVAIPKEGLRDEDCVVKSKDKRITAKVARIFSCKKGEGIVEGSIDLEIILGKKFAERF